MSDWAASIGPRRHLAEAAGWAGSVVLTAAFLASGAAFADWLRERQGRIDAQEAALMIDLAPLPPAEAAEEVPERAPSIPMAAAPDIPDAPDRPDELTPPAPPEETAPPLETPDRPDLPEPPAEAALPDTTPPEPLPEPEPEPVQQAEVALPKPRAKPPAEPKKAETQRKKPEEPAPAARSKPAQAAAASAASARSQQGSASPDEVRRWSAKVQSQLARHMRRGRFDAQAHVRFTLSIEIDRRGRLVAAGLAGSTGDGALDAAVLKHVRRIAPLAPPPEGASLRLALPAEIVPRR